MRSAAGFGALMLALAGASWLYPGRFDALGPARLVGWFLGWIFATWATNRYAQYGGQHRLTYAIAPALKFGAALGGAMWLLSAVDLLATEPKQLAAAVLLFTAADVVVSMGSFFIGRQGGRVPAPGLPIVGGTEQRRLETPTINTGRLDDDARAAVRAAGSEALSLVARHCPVSESSPRALLTHRVSVDAPTRGADVELGLAGCLNDQRRLIRHLSACDAAIRPGGWLLGSYCPHDLDDDSKNAVVRLASFVTHRALPKIPLLNMLYFACTRGRWRAVSRTEIWGRLQYSGFSLVEEVVDGRRITFLARKLHEPIAGVRPSYYPIVTLVRVGYHGRLIKLHKVRTMYPFSEFIQKQIYDQQQLGGGGKFRSDPRVNGWGRVLRRYWLDELPQILDWLRNELKLVGIRPMSRHFFSLYPADYQELFIQVKPGLIPPVFDQEDDSFETIVATEGAYLQDYLANPWRADVTQLWRTINRIARGVRSK